MEQLLVDAMRAYLAAGVAMDLDRLGACYDDEFQNLRVDQAGQVVTITKAQFMQRFADMKAQGKALEPADDATFPTATIFGDYGIVVMRRVKEGGPVMYAFVWRLRDGRPTTILRELSFEDDLTYLIKLMQSAQLQSV
ncbi:hypothetical protein AB0H43_04545 [Hamadaea sp. NPDC050747]|uniref:hypothetical protein n=1 Tax=Hamadaea sp. NPDC050747 TaxID=3155789 RepID=UPI0033D62838